MENSKLRESIRNTRFGAIAGFLVTLLSIFLAVVGKNYLNLIDAILVAFLAVGILIRKSRFASIVLLAYFFITKVVQFPFIFKLHNYTTLISFLLIALAFVAAFIVGVWGTYKYHRIMKTKLVPKNILFKTLISIAYFIITFIIFAIVLYILRKFYPIPNTLATLILFIPAEIVAGLSFLGLLPFSSNYPMGKFST